MNQKIIENEDFSKMKKRFRVNFINSLSGFKSLNLAGTICPNRKTTNLAPISSVIHIGATPPLLGMLIRPDSAPRNTLENIINTKHWTLNHVLKTFYKKAHQSSARYESDISEFSACGLQEEYVNFPAPFVKEANVKIGLLLEEKIDIKSNGTHFLIGRIIKVIIPERIIQEDGFLDLENAGTLTVSGLDSYHQTKSIERLPYAKP